MTERRLCVGRIGRWRGFYVGNEKLMLSCHVNGYGRGSQMALRVGDRWYGWWSDSGWAVKDQQPLKVTLCLGGQEIVIQAETSSQTEFVLEQGAEDELFQATFRDPRAES